MLVAERNERVQIAFAKLSRKKQRAALWQSASFHD